MSTGELLSIEPQELQFPFELKKQISCSLQLTNKTSNYVAFKVKTTNPKKYCVRPNTGIVLPQSTSDVIVTMQAQKEAPADMQCKDKFLLQSAVTSPGATTKDITPEMFHKESGNTVEECKLRVSYVAPPQPPSPVREGSDEGSSPRVSASDNGTLNTPEYITASSAFAERIHVNPQDNSSEKLAGNLNLIGKSRWKPKTAPENLAGAPNPLVSYRSAQPKPLNLDFDPQNSLIDHFRADTCCFQTSKPISEHFEPCYSDFEPCYTDFEHCSELVLAFRTRPNRFRAYSIISRLDLPVSTLTQVISTISSPFLNSNLSFLSSKSILALKPVT